MTYVTLLLIAVCVFITALHVRYTHQAQKRGQTINARAQGLQTLITAFTTETVPRSTAAPGPSPDWPAAGPEAAREAQIEVLQALINQTYNMSGPVTRQHALEAQQKLLAGRAAYRQNEELT